MIRSPHNATRPGHPPGTWIVPLSLHVTAKSAEHAEQIVAGACQGLVSGKEIDAYYKPGLIFPPAVDAPV
jgi:hypothetical protein